MNETDVAITNSDIVPVLTIDERRSKLPSMITRIVMGARIINPWHSRKDVYVLDDVFGSTLMSEIDFVLAKRLADKIEKENGCRKVIPSHMILAIRDRAQELLEMQNDNRSGKTGIVMLKDGGGCGYWRMQLPAKHMDKEGIAIDVTGGGLNVQSLMNYDTIMVQRLHDWDSVYILEQLKQAGKKIVYDIDDDLFSIPKSNPAFVMMDANSQMSAVECLKLADVVTTTTELMKTRLSRIVAPEKIRVIPNALDLDGWIQTPITGSFDDVKRIFWQGSSTHDEDWSECFDAVREIMQEREDVRLVILGFIPTRLREMSTDKTFRGRVEYSGPLRPEGYFQVIRSIRAEVGLAPLKTDCFNQGKSGIKWMENSMIGMPTVASNTSPYAEVIEHGHDGFLCSTTQEWKACIEKCLDDKRMRLNMIQSARTKIRENFDIQEVSKLWKEVLV